MIDVSSDDTVNAFIPEDTEDVDAPGEDQDCQSQKDDESPGPSTSASPPLERPPNQIRRCIKRFATASAVNISDSVRDLLIDAEIKGDEHRVRRIAAQLPVGSYDMAKRIMDRIQRIQCRVTIGNTAGSKHRVQYDASNDETYPATNEGERWYQTQIAEAISDWDVYFEQKLPLVEKSILQQQKKVLGRHLWRLSIEVLSWELVVSHILSITNSSKAMDTMANQRLSTESGHGRPGWHNGHFILVGFGWDVGVLFDLSGSHPLHVSLLEGIICPFLSICLII